MTTYWSLLERIPGSKLRLTKMDDDILEHLQRDFPELDPAAPIDEDKMKSKEGKERWRNFVSQYEKSVNDYNFGTMLRISPDKEYGEKETIFGETLTSCLGNERTCQSTVGRANTDGIQLSGCSSMLLKLRGIGRG
jgi:hypothetical protein